MRKEIIALVIIISAITITFNTTFAQQSEETGKEVVLYNGIKLPEVWPPEYGVWQKRKSMSVPYLKNPPDVIPINTGRQLFVDDYLIASTNLERIYHQPTYHNASPVLKATNKYEKNTNGPYAAPFSDGVWYDEKDKKFKMWYLTGAGKNKGGLRTAYAESEDGIHWEKPNLGIYGNTNIVDNTNRDAATIWLDKRASDPSKRFKMFIVKAKPQYSLWPMVLKYSSDGIHWSKAVAHSGGMYDRSTVFYNPFLSKWVISLKCHSPIGRARCYLEHSDDKSAVSLAHKFQYDTDIHNFQYDGHVDDSNIVFWFGAWGKDPRHPKFPDIKPQLYNFDAIAYESLMLGFFTVWQGPANEKAESLGIQKRNEVFIGYSRDGFHWQRPTHEPFMGVNEEKGAWNWGNVQSSVGSPIIKGDSLYFYVSGRSLGKGNYWDSNVSTGLATMRRDGFASMQTKNTGYILTRNLTFDGKYLFINADVKGSLRVEVLDKDGNVIQGYSRDESIPFKGDETKFKVSWEDKKGLEGLKNQPVKFRFYINNGEIYSFWVSPWATGGSRGYTAGGGPGLNPSGIDIPIK